MRLLLPPQIIRRKKQSSTPMNLVLVEETLMLLMRGGPPTPRSHGIKQSALGHMAIHIQPVFNQKAKKNGSTFALPWTPLSSGHGFQGIFHLIATGNCSMTTMNPMPYNTTKVLSG